jgi:hypothetical protein
LSHSSPAGMHTAQHTSSADLGCNFNCRTKLPRRLRH